MKNEWILDVLTDLRNFARKNDLPRLADQLDDTAMLAACELASAADGRAQSAAWRRGNELRAVVGELGRGK